jgi:hypothetical protein
MLKGGRFIWYYWNQEARIKTFERPNEIVLEGKVNVFGQVKKGIYHSRKITKTKAKAEWLIEDEFNETHHQPLHQRWHIHPDFTNEFDISATDQNGTVLKAEIADAFYSSYYGLKEQSKCIIFTSETKKIITRIALKP